ncbi:MAG TPA: MlaE family lipid ABC transporter permease subunit [Polyangiaceae bacterium]|nr:MlaE family lipid ABC transporter permease subunit [Polyangiaceae bacterium]
MSDADRIEPAPESFGDRIGRVAAAFSQFSWHPEGSPEKLELALAGRITIDEAPALWKSVSELLDRALRFVSVRIDLNGVDTIDGACLALLVHLQVELKRRGVNCTLDGGSPEVRRLIALYSRRRGRRYLRRRPRSLLEQVGEATADYFAAVVAGFDFLGQVVLAVVAAIKNPRALNFHEIAFTMERAGADAVPIVVLINFLIGFVMSYQSAVQLRQFGANIYVADLVGVAMTRELGPLMTAIIVCGRSGAAFAAELGTMKVSEEVDALRTLGILPTTYLVLPRLFGLVLVAPLLTLMADGLGIFGGLLVAEGRLDVTPRAFLTQLHQAVKPGDLISGLVKSMVFATAIALIACQQGLATSGGAEGVGRRTTGAVVTILFVLILLDAVFTVVFGVLHI